MKIMQCRLFKCCTFTVLGLAATLLIAQPVFAEDAIDDDWKFFTKLHLWAPDIGIESSTGTKTKIGIDDIIDNLDFTYMGVIGASKGKWTFMTDVVYLDLEHSHNSNLLQIPGLKLDVTNLALTAWIVTPVVAYKVVDTDRFALNLLTGARYLHLEVDTKTRKTEGLLFPTTTNSSNSVSGHSWDGIIGARGEYALTERWYLPFYCDVGTGENDLTWQVYGAVGYKFDSIDVTMGWRHLEWEFDDGDNFGEVFNTLYVSGPTIGIRYMF